jgi:hypothetical protein
MKSALLAGSALTACMHACMLACPGRHTQGLVATICGPASVLCVEMFGRSAIAVSWLVVSVLASIFGAGVSAQLFQAAASPGGIVAPLTLPPSLTHSFTCCHAPITQALRHHEASPGAIAVVVATCWVLFLFSLLMAAADVAVAACCCAYCCCCEFVCLGQKEGLFCSCRCLHAWSH